MNVNLPILFGAMHCDPFIRGTRYEEGQPEFAINALLSAGYHLPNHLQDKLRTCLKYQRTQDVIDDLKAYGKTVMLGGWAGNPAHAVIYEANVKEGTFSIYNGGAGLEAYHKNKFFDHKRKFYPRFTIKEIPQDHLLDEDFWDFLVQMNRWSCQEIGKSWSASVLYEFVKQNLLGKIDHSHYGDENWHYTNLMQSGSCWWRSVLAFCKLNMTQENYEELKYHFKRRFLREFYNRVKKDQDPSDVRLLEMGTRKFAHSLGKYFNKAVIGRACYLYNVELVDEILETTHHLNNEDHTKLWPHDCVPRTPFRLRPCVDLSHLPSSDSLATDPFFDCVGADMLPKLDNKKEFLPKEILNELVKIISYLEKIRNHGRKKEHALLCQETIRRLPSTVNRWKNIPQKDRLALCEQLRRLLGESVSYQGSDPQPVDYLHRLFLLYATSILVDEESTRQYDIPLLLQYSIIPFSLAKADWLKDLKLINFQDGNILRFVTAIIRLQGGSDINIFSFKTGMKLGDQPILLTEIPEYPIRSSHDFPLFEFLKKALVTNGLNKIQINKVLEKPASFVEAFEDTSRHPYPEPILILWKTVLSALTGLTAHESDMIHVKNWGKQRGGIYVTYRSGSKDLEDVFEEGFCQAVKKNRVDIPRQFSRDPLEILSVYDTLKVWQEHPDLLFTEEGFKALYSQLFTVEPQSMRCQIAYNSDPQLKTTIQRNFEKLLQRDIQEAIEIENLPLLTRCLKLLNDVGQYVTINVSVDPHEIKNILMNSAAPPRGFWLAIARHYAPQLRLTRHGIFLLTAARLFTALHKEYREEHYLIRALMNSSFNRFQSAWNKMDEDFWQKIDHLLVDHHLLTLTTTPPFYDSQKGCLIRGDDQMLEIDTGVLTIHGQPSRTCFQEIAASLGFQAASFGLTEENKAFDEERPSFLTNKEKSVEIYLHPSGVLRFVVSGEHLSKKAGVPLSAKRYIFLDPLKIADTLPHALQRENPFTTGSIPSAFCSSRMEGWLSLDQEVTEVILLDKEEDKVFAVIDRSQNVHEIKNKLHLNFSNIRDHAHLNNMIYHLENPSYQLVWEDENQRLSRVEFPRLGISLQIDGDQLVSEQFPGYTYRPYFKDFPTVLGNQGLMLENGKGNQLLILFHIGYLDANVNTRPFRLPNTRWPSGDDIVFKKSILTRRSDTELFEGSRESVIKLIISLIYMHRFQQALKYLYSVPRDPKLNKTEQSLFRDIINLKDLISNPNLDAFFAHLHWRFRRIYSIPPNEQNTPFGNYVSRFVHVQASMKLRSREDAFKTIHFRQYSFLEARRNTAKLVPETLMVSPHAEIARLFKSYNFDSHALKLPPNFSPGCSLELTIAQAKEGEWLHLVFLYLKAFLAKDEKTRRRIKKEVGKVACHTSNCRELLAFHRVLMIPFDQISRTIDESDREFLESLGKVDGCRVVNSRLVEVFINLFQNHDPVVRENAKPLEEGNPTGYAVLAQTRDRVDEVTAFLKHAAPIELKTPECSLQELIDTFYIRRGCPKEFKDISRLGGVASFPIGKLLLKDLEEAKRRSHANVWVLKDGAGPQEFESNIAPLKTLSREYEAAIADYLEKWSHLTEDGKVHLKRLLLSGEKEGLDLSVLFDWLRVSQDDNPQAKALAQAALTYDWAASIQGSAGRINALASVTLVDSKKRRKIAAFQYKMQTRLKPSQWKFAEELGDQDKTIHCLPCGSGKTAVITMLVNEISEKVVINAVPPELFDTHLLIMHRQSIKLRGMPAEVFRFDRQSSTKIDDLKALYGRLLFSKKHHLLVVTTPNDLQSLMLTYVFLTLKGKNEEASVIQTILLFFKNECLLLVDEIHRCLQANRELNFGMDTREALPGFRRKIPLMIQKIYDEEEDKSEEHLAKKVAEKLVPPNERNRCAIYLTIASEAIDPKKRGGIKRWLKGHDEETRHCLMLCRAHFQKYLKYTQKQKCFVDFGPREGVDEAVPYEANNIPAKRSSYTFYETVINLTILMYLEIGLFERHVIQLLTNLIRQHKQEAKRDSSAQEVFDSLTEGTPVQGHRLSKLRVRDPEQLAPYVEALKAHKPAIFYALEHTILPGINVDTEKLHSTGFDILNLFGQIVGLSATVANRIHYPPGFHFHFDNSLKADLLRNLTRPGTVEILRTSSFEMKEVIEKENVCCALDPGAFFRGEDNREVAQKLLKHAPEHMTVAAYFDLKTNSVMVIDRKGNTAPYQENTYPINTVLWYNDQWHCTGHHSDKPKEGVGVIILTPGLPFTALYQASERMRELDKLQKVLLIIDDAVYDEIAQMTDDEELTVLTVIRWALINEGKELEKLTPNALRVLMSQVVRQRIIKQILSDKPLGFSKQTIEDLFKEQVRHDKYREDSSLDSQETAVQTLKHTAKQYRIKYQDLLSSIDQDKLQQLAHRAQDMLPQNYRLAPDGDLSQTAEQQAACQSQEQSLNPTETFTPSIWSPHKLFIKAKTYQPHFRKMHRVFKVRGFNVDLFVSQNLLRRPSVEDNLESKDFAVFCLDLPKMDYILELTQSPRSKTEYFVLTKKEAERIAKFIKEKSAKYKWITFSLHHLSSEEVMTSNQDPCLSKNLTEVVVQVKFLNGCTHYSEDEMIYLRSFLFANDMDKKRSLFELLYHQRKSGVTKHCVLQGSPIEKLLFD